MTMTMNDDNQVFCGKKFWYKVYGDSNDNDYETCNLPAIACDLDDGEMPGRCGDHLPNFEYMDGMGFLPKPVEVITLLDRPRYPGHG